MDLLNNSTIEKEALFHQTYLKALLDNRNNLTQWQSYKERYIEVIKNLQFYNEKNKHSICIPVGKKALVKGELVHTNDVWVTLGCGWFLKTSSKKAIEICERRIKGADELIEKWEKENKLLESIRKYSKDKDTFGGQGSKEIVEPFDEQKEKQWKKEHRDKERQYKQQLKELKEKTGSATLNDEKDIWEHLEALEIQEELEDELNRLGFSESSSEEYENDSDDLSQDEDDSSNGEIDNLYQNTSRQIAVNSDLSHTSNDTVESILKIPTKNGKSVKKVTFKEDDTFSTVQTSCTDVEPVQVAISDVVVEKVAPVSIDENGQGEKRPISKFKMKKSSN